MMSAKNIHETTNKLSSLTWLSLLALVPLVSCSSEEPKKEKATVATQKKETVVTDDVQRLDQIIRRAMRWMTTIDVHPLRLREQKGMKGIKHMVEYLDFHYLVHQWSDDQELKKEARDRALKLLKVIEEDAYHNLASLDDKRFRGESMSYLRACWLATKFGINTHRYHSEIKKILPRLYDHLPTRGVDQRMGFALLLSQLGYDRPETEEQIYPESLIARQVPIAYYFTSADKPYDITHEIFALSARGTRPFDVPNPESDRYARETVRSLLRRSMRAGNIDIAGELLVNLSQLGEGKTVLTDEAKEMLFRGQNKDGSFGNYEKEAAAMKTRNPRYDVRIGGNLHTTMVCTWALTECVKNAQGNKPQTL